MVKTVIKQKERSIISGVFYVTKGRRMAAFPFTHKYIG